MVNSLTSLERAFQLAKSGEQESVTGIRCQLKYEGYNAEQICGPALARQLRDLIKASRVRAKGRPRPVLG